MLSAICFNLDQPKILSSGYGFNERLMTFILDYRPTKPVKSYVGSITDARLMRSAMRGCQSVIHLAAVTDTSMFPNTARLKEVHVKGN